VLDSERANRERSQRLESYSISKIWGTYEPFGFHLDMLLFWLAKHRGQ
jgi:hypothetical protein